MADVTSIQEIVSTWLAEGSPPEVLVVRLQAREDALKEVMHLAATQYGLYPQIVAEVLAEIGFGTPLDADTRGVIRANWERLMIELQEEHRRQHPDHDH